MNIFNGYIQTFKRWNDFSGRSRRAEFWGFRIIDIIILLFALAIFMPMAFMYNDGDNVPPPIYTLMGFFAIYFLLTFIPRLSSIVRRLHDANYSGWLVLITFIPFGDIVLFILNLIDSYPATNKWGPNPKGNDNGGNFDGRNSEF